MTKSLTKKYGKTALIAGGSEGIGAAFAEYLASQGVNLVLVARDLAKLNLEAKLLKQKYDVHINTVSVDLSANEAVSAIVEAVSDTTIDILVYNAAFSYIGRFEDYDISDHNKVIQVNVGTLTSLVNIFSVPMLKQGRGAIVIMSSLAGFQGSAYLATYASSKAYSRILAESLWYEWKNKGVDVIACCAGATSSPNYLRTNPASAGFFAPKVQTPHEVVKECFGKLGKLPSYITGSGNRSAGFFMHRILSRKKAINIMGNTTKKLYGIN